MTNLASVAFQDPVQQRILALAGMCQAANLVHQVANDGQLNEADAKICWQSLFVTDPKHISEVYGGADCLRHLRPGLLILQDLFSQNKQAPIAELTRYLIGMIHLQGKLSKTPGALNSIGEQLDHCQRQVELYGLEHANVTASLAEIYSQNLSQFRFRIQVTGSPIHLQQASNANRVRSLLLAGIRSAILWRQVGGRRWQFVLGKAKFQRALDALLQLSQP